MTVCNFSIWPYANCNLIIKIKNIVKLPLFLNVIGRVALAIGGGLDAPEDIDATPTSVGFRISGLV